MRPSKSAFSDNRISTKNGVLEGTRGPGAQLAVFLGVPFADPPVGDLRFAPPRPASNWFGVRRADRFGPRPMQRAVFGDMNFRSEDMDEDCLYLNIWTPANSEHDRLPVLVYFYGGGNMAGDGSEPRYDGAALARRGIVTLTANYRLGVFGFFAHPELSQEFPHALSGNQGYLDQVAALTWVRDNIAAFGGDPAQVTVVGESAGAVSVNILMASPLSRDLMARAIGSSGSAIANVLAPVGLSEKERLGAGFATETGAGSLVAMRRMPAAALLEASSSLGVPAFTGAVGTPLLPRGVAQIFAAGEQAEVPLLVGWNSEEAGYADILKKRAPTPENYARAVRALYAQSAEEVLDLYPARAPEEVVVAARDLASDRFMGYATWKWSDLHAATGKAPVYRYLYTHPRPPMVPELGDAVAGLAGGIIRGTRRRKDNLAPPGALHSADIEYAMGNLATNHIFAWTADDYKVSETMQTYYANFTRTGDPNGDGAPTWPVAKGAAETEVLYWDVEAKAGLERNRARYLFHDRILGH